MGYDRSVQKSTEPTYHKPASCMMLVQKSQSKICDVLTIKIRIFPSQSWPLSQNGVLGGIGCVIMVLLEECVLGLLEDTPAGLWTKVCQNPHPIFCPASRVASVEDKGTTVKW